MTAPSVVDAARGLLAATARLPGGLTLPEVRAVSSARAALLEALTASASVVLAPKRAPRASAWVAVGPETGATYPGVAREWRRADGAFVRLVRAAHAPFVVPTPSPGSLLARTPLKWPGPLAGHYQAWAGPGKYKGYVPFRAGDKAATDLPEAAIQKVLDRARSYPDNVCVLEVESCGT